MTYNCKVVASAGVKIRPEPSTSNTSNGAMSVNTAFQAVAIVPDADFPTDPTKVWGKIDETHYAALEYNGHICDYVLVTDPDPIPPNPSDVKRIIDSVITWEDVAGVVHTTRMIPE